MKRILIVFITLLFLSCSSDDSTPARRITFKVDGVYKIYEDIHVTYYTDYNWEVPFIRLSITAQPKDGAPEFFAVDINRGGDFDGQSRNGAAYLNADGYNYNFDHPLETHISVNTSKRIKGTFEGVYTNADGENINFTEGKIDITYYPDNGTYIKK